MDGRHIELLRDAITGAFKPDEPYRQTEALVETLGLEGQKKRK